jgi:hypothetical protein
MFCLLYVPYLELMLVSGDRDELSVVCSDVQTSSGVGARESASKCSCELSVIALRF